MIGKYKYDFNIPQAVKDLLNKLHTKYEAYIVGGCVRDLVLNKTPKDYDITTNATPEQIKELFKNYELINNNGEKHGTITVRYENENYEITTYRIDGDYKDNRHPDSVKFTTNLEEDLSRRDFTINALVYDGKYVIDYFGGINDLDNNIVKAVGDPIKRFNEDALRILRGIRFASQLNFKIEEKTYLAMLSCQDLLNNISKERIREELNKIITGKGVFRVLQHPLSRIILQILNLPEYIFTNFDQKSSYHRHKLWEHLLAVTDKANSDYIVGMAALLHDIGKPYCYQPFIAKDDGKEHYHFKGHSVVSHKKAIDILANLKYSNDDTKKILFLILEHDRTCNTYKSLKKFLAEIIKEFPDDYNYIFFKWLELREADKLDHINIEHKDYWKASVEELTQFYLDIINKEKCLTVKDLAINGTDLQYLGYKPGPLFKDILNDCLEKVLNEEIINEKESLTLYINKKYKEV